MLQKECQKLDAHLNNILLIYRYTRPKRSMLQITFGKELSAL